MTGHLSIPADSPELTIPLLFGSFFCTLPYIGVHNVVVFVRYVAHFLVPRDWTGRPRELASLARESLWDPQGKEDMLDAH